MNLYHYLDNNPWWALAYLVVFFIGTYTVAKSFTRKCSRCGR